MRFLPRAAVLYLAVTLAFFGKTWCQTATTSLEGTVSDSSGATIANATITLSNPERAFQAVLTTGTSGEYKFVHLQPAVYQLTIEMKGFRRYEQKSIHLMVNSPMTLNPILQVGASSEVVEVTGEGPLINTTDASLGNAFSERQVKELPLEGRNVPDLLSLQAGVTYTGNRQDINTNIDTRSGAVNGTRSDQSNLTLDGVDVNDNANGYAFTSVLPITADSVQEFRVTTGNYNADQGRSSGAQVSLVTKSGTNAFHGALYEYHRNTVTSANDYFVKNSQLAAGDPNKAPKLVRNIFGVAVGGPIIKDRLFFFANYEGARQREENSTVRVVPSAALRDGAMLYQCADPTACPGGTVAGNSASHAVPAGFFGLSPTQLKAMDPLGLGPNPVMLSYFNSFPLSNDNSVGDGVNFQGVRFNGPIKKNNDWYIARLDYKLTATGSQTLFWRGALRNDTQADVPYLPGTEPLRSFVDYSKGFTVGFTSLLRPTLANSFHWGFTRQSAGTIGNNDTNSLIFFRELNNNETTNNSSLAVVRSRNLQVPIHNLVDDISWSKGKHTLQFGTNVSFIRQPQSSFVNSFSFGETNASWFDKGGMAGTKLADHMDPGAFSFPGVQDSFATGYDYPLIALLGMVTQVNAQYNFDRSGNPLGEGAPVRRRFAQDSFEFYAQDAWKVRPNLTVTYGLRYSLSSPPWETNGLQVSPTTSLSNWFNQREAGMFRGVPSNQSPLISFDLSGPANGKANFYHWDTKDFAPRLAVAWGPQAREGFLGRIIGENKTTVRAGFGMAYDRLGQTLLSTFDQQGSFGMSTNLTNPGGKQNLTTAPRLTDLHTVPQTDLAGRTIFAAPPSGTFPQTFPTSGAGSFAVYWGLDDKLKTPYTYMLDFSVGREFPHHFSVEATYVGRLSHRLLTQSDLAMPLDLVDPKTGMDYFTAVTALSKVARNNIATQNFDPASVGKAAAYWTNMIQPLQPGGMYQIESCTGVDPATQKPIVLGTTSPVVAAYDLNCGFATSVGETTTIQALDQDGISDFNLPDVSYHATGGPNTFLSPQFASLYAWRSNSSANYHGLQVNLRKRMSQGVQFDLNYTFSKSIDLASDAQRIQGTTGGLGGQVINVWSPDQHRAVSDFDTTHQFNLNWIAELPFGRGKLLGRQATGRMNAIIGGWELSGLARWTSGFPFSVSNGSQWPTNWELSGFAVQTGRAVTKKTKMPDGTVNVFADPQGATGFNAFRADFPGESGQRNNLRGDGFAGLDLGLSKAWRVPFAEQQAIKFRWDVFNALNLTRFDVQSITTSITSTNAFGNYTGLLTNPRVMQFALRYEF